MHVAKQAEDKAMPTCHPKAILVTRRILEHVPSHHIVTLGSVTGRQNEKLYFSEIGTGMILLHKSILLEFSPTKVMAVLSS